MSRLSQHLIVPLTLGIGVASLSACSPARSSTDDSVKERSDVDTIASSDDADGIKGGETYSEFDERRDAVDPSPGSVADYGCTQDCSGHNAGYAWAAQRDITDADDCGGKSWSFVEGCRAYAEEQSKGEDE